MAPLIFSYKYDTVVRIFQNDTVRIAACVDPLKTEDLPQIHTEPSVDDNMGKDKKRKIHSYL